MSDWTPGCCHPTTGPHGPGEPRTCCHVHVEDLPSNRDGQQGEPMVPPPAWTAQAQARADQAPPEIQGDIDIRKRITLQDWATLSEKTAERHRHGFKEK